MSTSEEATRARRPRAGPRSGAPRSARRKSREFALQGLYEWLLGGADAGVVDAHVREQDGFDKCDLAYFDLLLHGVIRGETYHFELVANESASAVTRVGIDHGLAIANAILTCDTPAQAQARAEEKGRDAARVAVEMANLLDELS